MARTTDPEGHELHLHNTSMIIGTGYDIELNDQIESTATPTTVDLNQSDQTNTPHSNFRENIAVFNAKIVPFMIFLIIANSLISAIYTSNLLPATLVTNATDIVFYKIDLGFLIIFTIELGLHFIEYGIINLFKNSWLCFDFFIIAFSWFVILIFGSVGVTSVTVLRSLRILRVLSLINRIKALQHVLDILVSVIPEMMGILVLLLLIFFIFASLMTSLFGKGFECGISDFGYFQNHLWSLVTLFQFMTFDSWSYVVRDYMKFEEADIPKGLSEEMYAKCVAYENIFHLIWVFVGLFLIISGFILMNLIITIMSNASNLIAEKRKEKLKRKASKGNLNDSKRNDIIYKPNENKMENCNCADLHEKIIMLTTVVGELSNLVKQAHLGKSVRANDTHWGGGNNRSPSSIPNTYNVASQAGSIDQPGGIDMIKDAVSQNQD